MSSFVACWKRTLHQSLVTVRLLYEIILEAKSDLEMSEERRRFREHPRQSFELGRSISSRHFGKFRKHSNEIRSSVLLKLKPGADNDAQRNEKIGVASNGTFVRWSNPVLSMRPQTAGQGSGRGLVRAGIGRSLWGGLDCSGRKGRRRKTIRWRSWAGKRAGTGGKWVDRGGGRAGGRGRGVRTGGNWDRQEGR